jgi:hypothetical protein
MKQALLFFISLLFSLRISSQPGVRLIKFYDLPPHYGSYSYDVTTTDFGYILSGIIIDTANGYGYNRLTLMAVDSLGDSLWTKSYGSSAFQYVRPYTGKWMTKKDNNLYLSCPVVKPGDTMTSVLIKFNINGDTVWQKEYSDIQYQLAFENFKLTPDKGFIFTGYVTGGGNRSLMLLKADSLGNELWRKKINTGTIEIDGRGVVYDSINKKYVIAGYQSPSPSYDPRSLVIVTDSVGNKLNQFSFSGPQGGEHYSLIQSYDNNFIACGVSSTGIPISSFTKVRAQTIKFDISGNVIWSKEYGVPAFINSLTVLKELPDRSIVAGGEYDTVYNSGLGLNSSFILRKMNQNGDSLWIRTIDLTKNNGNQDVFTGMDITHDGGFVLTGYTSIDTSLNRYELVKLDSLGCDSIGCQFTGIDEQKIAEQLNVYPNPTSGDVTITITNSVKQIKQISVYDIVGKELERIINFNKSSNISINIESFGKGTFLLKMVLDDNSFSTQKIVTY